MAWRLSIAIGATTAIAGTVAASPAWALEGTPHYDITAGCRALARTDNGFIRSAQQACMQRERHAKQQLGQMHGISAPIKRRCKQVARAGRSGSYVALVGCIRQQQAGDSAQ